MTKYNIRIFPRHGNEAITYSDQTAEQVYELFEGLPSDTFKFMVLDADTGKEVEYPIPEPKKTEE
jgi:hypothetical protein